MCHAGFCFVFLLTVTQYFHSVNPLFGNQQLIQKSTTFLAICNKIAKGTMTVNNCRVNRFILEGRSLKVKNKQNKTHYYTPTDISL